MNFSEQVETEIKEGKQFLLRVYGDLRAADGFVGITPEQIFEEKVEATLRKVAEVARHT